MSISIPIGFGDVFQEIKSQIIDWLTRTNASRLYHESDPFVFMLKANRSFRGLPSRPVFTRQPILYNLCKDFVLRKGQRVQWMECKSAMMNEALMDELQNETVKFLRTNRDLSVVTGPNFMEIQDRMLFGQLFWQTRKRDVNIWEKVEAMKSSRVLAVQFHVPDEYDLMFD